MTSTLDTPGARSTTARTGTTAEPPLDWTRISPSAAPSGARDRSRTAETTTLAPGSSVPSPPTKEIQGTPARVSNTSGSRPQFVTRTPPCSRGRPEVHRRGVHHELASGGGGRGDLAAVVRPQDGDGDHEDGHPGHPGSEAPAPRAAPGGGRRERSPPGRWAQRPDEAAPAAGIGRVLEAGRSRLRRNAGQQCRDGDQRPPSVPAGRAAPAVLDHPGGELFRRQPHRLERHVGQAGAVVAAHPGQEDGADDVLGLIGGGLDRHRRQTRCDPQRLAEGLALQAVAQRQVDAAPLDGVEQERGRPGQPLQLVGRSRPRLDQVGAQWHRRGGVPHRHGEDAAEEERRREAGTVRFEGGRYRLPDDRHGPLGVSGDGQSKVVQGVAVLFKDPVRRPHGR